MTKAQKKKVIDIISKDANQRFVYYQDGATCVIGGLLKADGMTDEQLKELGTNGIASLFGQLCRLKVRFGLEYWDSEHLQQINDKHRVTAARRKALIEYVKDIGEDGND